jgi:DnaJ-class molecular chaperone
MPDKVHNDFLACPACDGKGTVESRLPFRTKPCHQCAGRGVVTPIRREQLLKRVKERERGG